jgi:hypothetical protein
MHLTANSGRCVTAAPSKTEADARKDAEDLQERGYGVVVWRELQRKINGRWKTDFDDPLTQPLDDE